MKNLEIDFLLNTEWWASLITALSNTERKAETSRSFSAHYNSLRFAVENLPGIVSLLSRASDFIVESPDIDYSNISSKSSSFGDHLELILSEAEGQVSTAKRVSDAITAMMDIYYAIATLRKLPDNGLSILACDSGSDKIFDFSGLGEVIKEAKDLILSVWSLCIYHKEKKFKERIDAIAHALPVLKELSELEQDGKIEKEAAEIVRRKLIAGVELFLETGSSIPEMARESTFIPRLVMKPGETLLLAAPKEGSTQSSNQNMSATASFDEDSEGSDKQDDLDSMSIEQLRAEMRKRPK